MSEVELISVRAVDGASEILWELMEERSHDPAINISHTAMPPRSEHEEFVERYLRGEGPYYRWYLVAQGEDWLGSVNVTTKNEVGIVLFELHRGKGHGKAALEALIKLVRPLPAKASYRPGHFLANINPDNERSIRLFTSLGFVLKQHTYALEEKT